MSLLGIIILILFISLIFGWWWPGSAGPDSPRSPYVGWSPAVLLLIILLVLLVTGVIHV